MFGYAGKILYVNLDHNRTKSASIESAFCEKYIGGNGFSIRLLHDTTKPGLEPFEPENALIFAVGPFAGTTVPTSGKYIVQAKSPLTGFMGESISSGLWGQALKRAGYDAVVIRGKAEKPTYLFIDDDNISFVDAKRVWGQDSIQTNEIILEEIGDENVGVAAIGPAGENLVRFANITNDRYRQAGRTGMGAVAGSKNLKAVAVRGTKTIEVHDLDKLIDVCRDLNEQCQGPEGEFYRKWGTPGMVMIMNHIGVLPTRNYQQSSFELAENLSGEYIQENYAVKALSCAGCPIACDHIPDIESGPYTGTVASVDFETIYALGPECGIGYYPAIAKATDLCDRLGIDTISTGVAVGWAMECYEKGILTKDNTDGIELTFGNHEALIEVVKKIAYREGIGRLLADGVKRASEKVGKGSEHFAMHNKGLELPGYDVRGLKASALGFMTSTRGGCHLRSMMPDLDRGGKIDRLKAEESYGKMVMDREDLMAVMDSLILCKFIRRISTFFAFDKFAELLGLVAGINLTPDELQTAGARIYNLEKAYNVREGWTKKDDYPPLRIMREPIPDGPSKGSVLTKKEFDKMLNSYFEARGWNHEGLPRKEKLIELGLDDVSESVEVQEEESRNANS